MCLGKASWGPPTRPPVKVHLHVAPKVKLRGRPVWISEKPQLEKPAKDGDAGVIVNCKAPGLRGQGQG